MINLEGSFLTNNLLPMKKNKSSIILFTIIFVSILLQSCATVKEYDKVYLNDPDMTLGEKPIFQFETTFQAYREAASGANGGKTGGGCGCN